MFPEELKHILEVLEDIDDWKDQISANKQLKVLKGDQLQLDVDLQQKILSPETGKDLIFPGILASLLWLFIGRGLRYAWSRKMGSRNNKIQKTECSIPSVLSRKEEWKEILPKKKESKKQIWNHLEKN